MNLRRRTLEDGTRNQAPAHVNQRALRRIYSQDERREQQTFARREGQPSPERSRLTLGVTRPRGVTQRPPRRPRVKASGPSSPQRALHIPIAYGIGRYGTQYTPNRDEPVTESTHLKVVPDQPRSF